MSGLARFKRAQDRSQRARDDARWISQVDADNARAAPSQPGTRPSRVAHVTRGTLGDREVTLSQFDARAIGAFKHCRDGATRPTWDAHRKVWAVPASRWSCVRGPLIAEGYEVREVGA